MTDDRRQLTALPSGMIEGRNFVPLRENNPPLKPPKVAHISPLCVFFPLRLCAFVRVIFFSPTKNSKSRGG